MSSKKTSDVGYYISNNLARLTPTMKHELIWEQRDIVVSIDQRRWITALCCKSKLRTNWRVGGKVLSIAAFWEIDPGSISDRRNFIEYNENNLYLKKTFALSVEAETVVFDIITWSK